ncbi:MAG TPA: response regulator transcription factor [Acidimicrobiales bacterium]|nr:response regulator transcription factor [Acidimicrobiales bacterium]
MLVLTDDWRGRLALVEALRAERYEVEVVEPHQALETVASRGPDALVVDAPSSGRVEVCRRLRELTSAAIVVLGEPGGGDAAECLDRGADDYVAHPERPREIAARVRARLRRAPPTGPRRVLNVGELSVDLDRHEVTVGGRAVHLALKQFRLLELLLSHPGQVLTSGTIAERVWGPAEPVGANTLQAQVARLRSALGDEEVASRIRSVPGLGYTFRR